MAVFDLLERFGLEIEYMIVDRRTLGVLPIADRLLVDRQGRIVGDLVREGMGWSNELAAHVLEIKTLEPVADVRDVASRIDASVDRANEELRRYDACLMPTGMHPWMDPARETVLWRHVGGEIYEAFDRVFGCAQHGWANIQSTQLNVSFAGDESFHRLLGAVRLVLPVIPALAASSPFCSGRQARCLDARISEYVRGVRMLPPVLGELVPEPCASRSDYERDVLAPMYEAASRADAARVLCHEWLNARGAIARFDRGSVEIRLVDTQECPRADVAICELLAALLRALHEDRWTELERGDALSSARLQAILMQTALHGDDAFLEDTEYLAVFGKARRMRARELWRELVEALIPEPSDELQIIVDQGCLARRMLTVLEGGTTLPELYRMLCSCLASGQPLSS